MPYFHISRGLRGCYMPDSSSVIRATTRRELKAAIEYDARDMLESYGHGYSARDRVATIAIKRPTDGAGRLWAYVHWIGAPMVRGYASGYGYDKATAAVASAVVRIDRKALPFGGEFADAAGGFDDFVKVLKADTGPRWYDQLEKAGFHVLQAV